MRFIEPSRSGRAPRRANGASVERVPGPLPTSDTAININPPDELVAERIDFRPDSQCPASRESGVFCKHFGVVRPRLPPASYVWFRPSKPASFSMSDRHRKTALFEGATCGTGTANALQFIADSLQVYADPEAN